MDSLVKWDYSQRHFFDDVLSFISICNQSHSWWIMVRWIVLWHMSFECQPDHFAHSIQQDRHLLYPNYLTRSICIKYDFLFISIGLIREIAFPHDLIMYTMGSLCVLFLYLQTLFNCFLHSLIPFDLDDGRYHLPAIYNSLLNQHWSFVSSGSRGLGQ